MSDDIRKAKLPTHDVTLIDEELRPMMKAFFEGAYSGQNFLLFESIGRGSFSFDGLMKPLAIKGVFGEIYQPNLHENSIVVDPVSRARCKYSNSARIDISISLNTVIDLMRLVPDGTEPIMHLITEGMAAHAVSVFAAVWTVQLKGHCWNRARDEGHVNRDDVINVHLRIKGWKRPGDIYGATKVQA